MTRKEQTGGGFNDIPTLGLQSSLPAPSPVWAEVLQAWRQRPGSRSQGGGEQPTLLVAQGLHRTHFRLISQGEPMEACGPLPSAWALLRSHHPTEWDGTVHCLCSPDEDTEAPRGTGTCQAVGKWQNRTGQGTLHTPEPVLAP